MEQGFRSVLSVVRAAAAMLLATTITTGRPAPGAAWAETFVIPDGDVPALVAAIQAANINGEHDIIELAANGMYVVDSISSSLGGGSAFPLIEPDRDRSIDINGRGATIVRDPSAEPMRFFFVLDEAFLTLNDVALVGGLIETFEGGGAIRVQPAGTLWLERCALRDNKSPLGATIHATGTTWIVDTEVTGSSSDTTTAAIVVSDLRMQGSTVRNNGANADEEGAIHTLAALTLINSTISGNAGYGVFAPNASGGVQISNSTITDNTGPGLLDSSESDLIAIHNTVVAGNSPNCTITASIFGTGNIADDDSCPSGEAFTVVENTQLAPLADNGGVALPGGGSPRSMVPLHNSPLVDGADSDECLYFTDQIGKPRSVDGDGDGDPICDVGAVEFQLFQPVSLEVDYTAMGSDGNGVLEPDEDAPMAPAWRYDFGSIEDELAGFILSVVGPEGGNYFPTDGAAEYGVLSMGTSTSCRDNGPEDCYVISIEQQGSRPALHWDAAAVEQVVLPDFEIASQQEWKLHIGKSFPDVASSNTFYRFIETILHSGVTAGCTATSYCPASTTSRQQVPVFVLRALEGSNYSPPTCVTGNQPFTDVPASNPFCPWIRELAARDVIAGCGNGKYCPTDPVSRAQMAVYSLKTLEGGDYTPPPCASSSERFTDVPATHLFCPWIEELARRGIVSGCDSSNYCPGSPVSRAQMSVFVTRTFGLKLYGP